MKIILKNLLTTLRRFPTAVLLNVVGLSVAFTAFVVILMQVNFEYSFDRDVPGAERVFRVELNWGNGHSGAIFNQQTIEALIPSSAHIEAGSLMKYGITNASDFRVEHPNGTQGYFRLFQAQVTPPIVGILGMDLLEGDSTALQHRDQLLLPQSLARRMFGDAPAVGQKLFDTDNEVFMVGGVYRDFPANSVLPNVAFQGHPWTNSPNNTDYMFFVRLDDPASAADVEAAMTAKFKEFKNYGADAEVHLRLTNIRDIYFRQGVLFDSLTPKGSRTTTGILLAIAVLVLFIASVNYVNFASALTPMRMKMINLQKVLGARVWQLRLSLLVESAVIALVSYLLALGFVAVLSGTSLAGYVMADMRLGANLPLVGRCALIALGVGVAAGLYPAFYMTSFQPILAVKGTFGTSPTGRRYRLLLVGVQYVISLALIVATLFVNLQNRFVTFLELGYDKAQIVVADLPNDALAKRDVLTERLKSYSGIEDVAFSYQKFGTIDRDYMSWGMAYKDYPDRISLRMLPVTDGFLRTLGIPVTQGRDFSPSDNKRAQNSYLVNGAAHRRYGIQPGDSFSENEFVADGAHDPDWGEVVGIISDSVRIFSQYRAEEPVAFYVPGVNGGRYFMPYGFIRLKSGTDLLAAVDHIRGAIEQTTPYDYRVEFMDSAVNSLYEKELRSGVLVTLFSLLAIFVSLMGVFGLVLFETQYRRKEIGIRKVNGATSASILWMFNRRFVVIVLVSFLFAAPVAWYGVDKWLQNFLGRIPLHAWVFAAALVIVLVITVLTVTVRSWRTANENPVRSIKTE